MDNTIVSDSVLEKIKKLLQLATSDNLAEKELAMVKAQRLAAEHSVDLSLIKIFDKTVKSAPIEKKDDLSLGKRKCIAQKYVNNILQNHFNLKILYSGSRYSGMNLILIGTKENIDLGTYLNGFLNETFMNLWRDYFKKSNCPLNHRGSFLSGVESGLSEKLTNEQKQVIEEKMVSQPENIKQEFGLMVISEKERLKKAVSDFYPRLGKSYSYSGGSYSSDAISKGREAGQSISIRRGIGFSSSKQIS